jgi:hypothetical protein
MAMLLAEAGLAMKQCISTSKEYTGRQGRVNGCTKVAKTTTATVQVQPAWAGLLSPA